jgi:hypothetical protein
VYLRGLSETNNWPEGVGHIETFALVAKLVTIQIVLVIVAVKGWKMKQMDMHNTFLRVVGLQSFL